MSSKELKVAKDICDKFGAAYVARNLTSKQIEKTVVRLTERGYKALYLKSIAHQRPIPFSEPRVVLIDKTPYYELEFDCSYMQIRNYFFSFGTEAEIISPELLREQFIQDYKHAIERYDKKR